MPSPGGYLAGDRHEAAAAPGNTVAATVIQHRGAITPLTIQLVGSTSAAHVGHWRETKGPVARCFLAVRRDAVGGLEPLTTRIRIRRRSAW